MRKQKYYLRLTDAEHHLIFQCLLEYRNKLTSQGKYADGVDGTHNQLCFASNSTFKCKFYCKRNQNIKKYALQIISVEFSLCIII